MEQRQQSNGRQNGGGGGRWNDSPPQVNREAMALAVRHTGNFTSVDRLTEAMAALSERCNVLTPVSRIAAVPAGHAITLSTVTIDPDQETYSVDGGKRGLSKAALDKIASAAGISWDPRLSGRLDNGSDPHYAHYRAVGHLKDVDGTERVVSGEVEIDMREGSAQVVETRRRAEQKAAQGKKADPEKEIAQVRTFILRHAESKAKNRAIRGALAVRGAYRPEDLSKPFVCPKLVFTGDFGDAETNRQVHILTAVKALGLDAGSAASVLYGPRQPMTAVRSDPQAVDIDLTGPARLPPPPVNGSVRHLDHDPDDDAIPGDSGPPAEVVQGEPKRIGELPDDAQVAELVDLAARKGKLGEGEGLISAARIARLSPRNRADLWTKLSDLEDAAPAQTDDHAEDEDEIRF